jgi:hypothetical protein
VAGSDRPVERASVRQGFMSVHSEGAKGRRTLAWPHGHRVKFIQVLLQGTELQLQGQERFFSGIRVVASSEAVVVVLRDSSRKVREMTPLVCTCRTPRHLCACHDSTYGKLSIQEGRSG